MNLRSSLALAACLGAALPVAHADEVAAAPAGPALTVKDAVQVALSRNFGLAASRASTAATAEAVDEAEAFFDVTANLGLGVSDRQSASATSGLDGAAQPESSFTSWEASITKPLPTGGTLTFGGDLGRSASNSSFRLLNPEYASDLAVSLRQPLLRDAGPTSARAGIERALSDLLRARLDLRDRAARVAAEVELAYWGLAAARESLELRRSSLAAAESLLRETEERARVGLATELDVLQARARVAAQRQGILRASQDVEDAEDQLRIGMGDLPESTPVATRLQVAPLPAEAPAAPAFDALLARVLANDPSLGSIDEAVAQRERDRREARRDLLPAVNLVAGAGLLGVDGDHDGALGGSLARDGDRWNVGVEVSVPWGNRAARARAQAAEFRVTQAQAQAAEARQALVAEVRAQWRAVLLGRDRLEADRVAVEASRLAYEQARARLKSGLSTLREVLEAQGELDAAEITLVSSRLALRRATVTLSRLDGSLLSQHGLNAPDIAP